MNKYLKIFLIGVLISGFCLTQRYSRPLWRLTKVLARTAIRAGSRLANGDNSGSNGTGQVIGNSNLSLDNIYHQQTNQVRDNQQTETEGQVKVTTTLGNNLISAEDKSGFLMLTLEGLAEENGVDLTSKRPDLNIAFVIDRSGSMSGQKIESVKQALVHVSKFLQPDDKVSLVIYDDRVQTVYEPDYFDSERFLDAARSIRSGGSTYLEGGLKAGLDHILSEEGDRTNRVILLSDGLANVGEDNPYLLGEMVKRTLDKDNRNGSTAISTIGVGADFDEILMTEVAKAGRGNYYFLEAADQAKRIFAQEFDQASSVLTQNLEVELDLEPGVKIVDSFAYEITGQQLNPQNVISGQTNNYLLQFELAEELTNNNQVNLGQLIVRYNSANLTEVQTNRQLKFTLKAEVSSEQINPLAADSVYQEFMDSYRAQKELEIYQDLERVDNKLAKDKNYSLVDELKQAAARLPGVFDENIKKLEDDQEYIESLGESDVKSSYEGKIFQKERQNSAVDKLNNK